ncbi:hypothetical protein EG850_06575 [Gulosibacter macacae]|uniref:Uncharacterized protein n=1 Tax=Gulosibacter macacae TaxID=2488791 RepID=A0A3P3VW79_9MICO|nr:hypothetical protein [Gulosibacter macacae]RRJ87061.1 hypothetical protein EG850_06575 [Gulosibacter macacae]
MFLLIYVIGIAIGGVMALGGIALAIIGIVLLVRAPHAGDPVAPQYSGAVPAQTDGLEVPSDFEDAPQWIGTGIVGDEAAAPVDNSVLVKDARRRGTAFLVGGLLLLAVGTGVVMMPMGYLFFA